MDRRYNRAVPAKLPQGLVGRFASRLRFPQLFAVAAILFVVDLLIPDLIPFFDEILLGLVTALLASLKRDDGSGEQGEKPPMKDVTPQG